MRDIHNGVKFEVALVPQTLAATTNGATIDTAGANGVELVINVGDFAFDGTNSLAVKLQHGDLANGSDMADVETQFYLGGVLNFNAASFKNKVHKVGYVGHKRYVRVVFTETGTVSVPISATFTLNAIHKPV